VKLRVGPAAHCGEEIECGHEQRWDARDPMEDGQKLRMLPTPASMRPPGDDGIRDRGARKKSENLEFVSRGANNPLTTRCRRASE
jgi:hypothetical protein